MQYAIRRTLTPDERNKLAIHSDIVAHLLYHRGIVDDAAARDFIEPDYDIGTNDPFLLKDAEKAADRIIHAITSGEKIAIYADYDADGIPGAVIWNDFFKRIGFLNFIIYIPHRHDEGFGLNIDAVEKLAQDGASLIVTVDCGIADIDPVDRANELGIDVIITDHHEPPLTASGLMNLPLALAVVDHKQTDCLYPDKNICGAGVAFKLIQAILKKQRFGLKDGVEKWLLDLVGMATLSDMVPLVGENRIFAHFGLTVLRISPRKGLMQLLRKLKINQRYVTEDDVGFMITPRINAASRMGVPMDAFKLLASDTDDDAYTYAEHLDKINNERKGVVASLVKEVKKSVNERHGAHIPQVIVLGNPLWRPSLLGLAANSCAEEFDRPVFLWGRDGENLIKGSCRSEGRSNVVELMRAVPKNVFVQFGGHKHSGGFVVANDAVHYLEQILNDAAKIANKSPAEGGVHDEVVDMELTLGDINMRLYEDIAKLAPFGIGNPKPIFLFKNVRAQSVRTFGKTNDHVEIVFKKPEKSAGSIGSNVGTNVSRNSGEKISAIAFFGASSEWAKALEPNMPINLVASLEKSMFRGRTELRLRIVDVLS